MHRHSLTIRLRVVIASSLLLLAIFSGMTVYLVRTNTTTLRSNLQNEAKAFASLATAPVAESYNIYSTSGTDQIKVAMRRYLELNKNITNISIVDLNGSYLFSYKPNKQHNITVAQASSFKPIFVKHNGRLSYVIYPYFSTSGAHPFSLVYNISTKHIDSTIRHEIIFLVAFGILLLVLTAGLTIFLIDRIIIKPVREVSRQAKVISDGNLDQQIDIHGHDEITQLGQSVNTMAESLKDKITQLKEIDQVKSEFMAITSHNLRTPLTIINGYLESVEMFKTVDKLKEVIDKISESTRRLGSFAEDVLTISNIELGESIPQDKINVKEFMDKIIVQADNTAKMHGLTLQAKIDSAATLNASEPYLRSAIWNLVDNSTKFTSEGGNITIAAIDKNGQVQISVTDTGIGIPAEEMPKLFTKFHRATSVLRYNYQGTGIGLYTTKIIIEKLGGTITVKSEEGKGSTFTIILPVVSAGKTEHTGA